MDYQEKIYESADGLSLFYRLYGNRETAKTTFVCLAGLTRSSADFHELATWLATEKNCFIIAPDMRGRGQSFYDPEPTNYNILTEAHDITLLLEQEKIEKAVFLGTSRGGLNIFILSHVLFSHRPDMCQGIILNDIGTRLEITGLARIMGYIGKAPTLANWAEAMTVVQKSDAGMTEGLTTADWMAYAYRTFVMHPTENCLVPAYDLGLAEAFTSVTPEQMASLDFSESFAGLPETAPILIFRGAKSDLLSPETVNHMKTLKPDCITVEVSGRGHVPWLNEPVCIQAIEEFIEKIA